jgi:hypothetical protein
MKQAENKKWEFEIEKCDVDDKNLLKEYRSKVESWLDILDYDECSIKDQLQRIMWEDTIWRCANEARRFSTEEQPTAARASLLAHMLDCGYVNGQIVGISRLLDKRTDVHSLKRLVSDFKKNHRLFTREIFVSHDGLPYDFDQAYTKWCSEQSSELSHGEVKSVRWIRGGVDFIQSQKRHEIFDRLSGHSGSGRKRQDKIGIGFFERLENILGKHVFKDILDLRNKRVAHSADANSRATVPQLRIGLSLDEFSNAHAILNGVTQAISSDLLHHVWLADVVATPQYNQFEYMDCSFVPSDKIGDLSVFWNESCEKANQMGREVYSDLVKQIY